MNTNAYNFLPVPGNVVVPQSFPLTNVREWTLPRARQTSRLLALPAELRLKILQELLKTGVPISDKTEDPNPRTHRLLPTGDPFLDNNGVLVQNTTLRGPWGYGLAPEILATCQWLHSEGWQELYANPLNIDITISPKRHWVTTHFVCPQNNPICTKCAMMTCLNNEPMTWITCNSQGHYDPNLEQVAMRFRHWVIDLNTAKGLYAQNSLRRFVNRMNSVAAGKRIDMCIYAPSQLDWHHDIRIDKILHVFRLMRCQGFKFTHKVRNDPMHDNVEREIWSNAPILDLARRAGDLELSLDILRKHLLNQLLSHNNAARQPYDDVQELWNDLMRAVETFDAALFVTTSVEIRHLFVQVVAPIMGRMQRGEAEFTQLQVQRQGHQL